MPRETISDPVGEAVPGRVHVSRRAGKAEPVGRPTPTGSVRSHLICIATSSAPVPRQFRAWIIGPFRANLRSVDCIGKVSMERLNEAMALVERQLEGEVDVRRASRIALMSEHHFRRMFSALAGISLSEYVWRLSYDHCRSIRCLGCRAAAGHRGPLRLRISRRVLARIPKCARSRSRTRTSSRRGSSVAAQAHRHHHDRREHDDGIPHCREE